MAKSRKDIAEAKLKYVRDQLVFINLLYFMCDSTRIFVCFSVCLSVTISYIIMGALCC